MSLHSDKALKKNLSSITVRIIQLLVNILTIHQHSKEITLQNS
jgi:hypothetical protein